MSWQRYVVRYSVHDQVRVVHFFRAGGRDILQKLKGLADWNWQTLVNGTLSPIILALILILIFFLVLKRHYGWQGFTLSPHPPLSVILYQDMLRQLKKSGLVKKPSWTVREFLASTSSLPDTKRDPIRRITEFYEKHRFGNSSIQASQEKEIRGLIASL